MGALAARPGSAYLLERWFQKRKRGAVARTAEFDRNEVLERAMHLFWRKGFEASSVQDLVEATGINRASMYNAFGDKEALFLASIDHYVENVNRQRLALLEEDIPAREAIARYFDALVTFSAGEGRRLGCLLTNTAIEMGTRNRRVERRLAEVFARVRTGFEQVVRRGQAAGDIPPDKDPATLAQFLLCCVQGLRVLARTETDARSLRAVTAVALSALE
jgi:TetR/AcrR family transcriptional regulator, transcriptional repressor for nem operon